MEHPPLVKINSGSAGEIARLYGVGPQLAKRIVKFRDTHGAFQRPEELAEVDGISLDHALTLSPFIDWSVCPESVRRPGQREWSAFAICVVAFVVILWFAAERVRRLAISVTAQRSGAPLAWISIWIDASLLLIGFCAVFAISVLIVSALSRNVVRAGRLQRRATIAVGLTLLIWVVSVGLANAVYYHFYAPQNWRALIANSPALAGIAMAIVGFLICGPQLLVLWRPAVVRIPWIHRAFDVGLVIATPSGAWTAWVTGDLVPLWVRLITGVAGIILSVGAIRSFRTGDSLFNAMVEELLLGRVSREQDGLVSWRAWINARLPDPEEQKALKRALDEAYPPSRVRTFGGLIVLGAGGWLTITALGGIVQWVVGKWLETVTGWR